MEEKFNAINKTFSELSNELKVKGKAMDNIMRRKYYSKIELLRLDILELETLCKTDAQKDVIAAAINQIDTILPILNLQAIKRQKKWWHKFEAALKFVGVICSFVILGTVCALPLLAIRAIDIMTNRDPFDFRSQYFIRGIAFFVLYQVGIIVDVEGVKNEYFKESCICPIRQLAFGKKELFMVPFFSWISLALGGVPVDRGNRDRAVGALKRTTEAATTSKVCIAVAPEGTRSNSGQLLPFKKGPFYMWDELKAPIVPMLIFGAYDLYPVGSWVNKTGHVSVRYLPPIYANEAKDRDEMLVLLRRRMLESLAQCPETIGKDISPMQWLLSILMNFLVIGSVFGTSRYMYSLLVNQYHFTLLSVAMWWLAIVISITVVLYVYYVYIIDMKNSSSSGSTGGKKQKSESGKSNDAKKKE